MVATLATNWCLVLSRSSDFGDSPLKSVETHLFGAHMSVLALHHLAQCLSHLQDLGVEFPPKLAGLVTSFRREYQTQDVKRVRDELEHEEDRVAGINIGNRPPYEGDDPLTRITGHKSDDTRLSVIRVLGEDHQVRGVIDAALALDEPLRELAEQLLSQEPSDRLD